jgi:protein-S-isoprenylcysteine O-methyltransferase Ste14
MLGVFIVAGVDGGDWPAGTPGAAWWSGVVLFAAGWTLVIWSMIVNPFFEKTVRIQIENDHRVVDTGPYACVRHPGYVGFSLWMISTPLLLASRLAVIPAVCATAVFVVRVVLEDRMLRRELPGYAEYATRTRFRLIPGVW